MIAEPKTLALIDQIDHETGNDLSTHVVQRLADLRHLIAAGATLTTTERAEVAELWHRYARAGLQTSAKTLAPSDVAGDPRAA